LGFARRHSCPCGSQKWTITLRIFYWLGLSIGMHAFPSTGDLSNLWQVAPRLAKGGNIWAILSVLGILYVLNFARVIWADLGYGIAVGILGPLAIFRSREDLRRRRIHPPRVK